MVMSGERRSCATEYENASSSWFTTSSSADALVQLVGALGDALLEVREEVRGFHGDGGAVRQCLQQTHFFRRGLVSSLPSRRRWRRSAATVRMGIITRLFTNVGAVGVVRDARVDVDVLDDRRPGG